MKNLEGISQTLVVLSGKGGVGKSTVAVQLALSLVDGGKKVGILDLDICGPSVPHMLGLGEHDVHQSEQGWIPVYTTKEKNLCVMSIGFLLQNKNDAVIWRGPKKNSMIRQFVTDVSWGTLDYLIIDTPPGTSDEHMSVMEVLKDITAKAGILVTTSSLVAVADVRREVTFCEKTGLSVLGIVENMSGSWVCPNCKDCSQVIFPQGGTEKLSEESGLPVIGRIPIDPDLVKCAETGVNFIEKFRGAGAYNAFLGVRDFIISKIDCPMEIE